MIASSQRKKKRRRNGPSEKAVQHARREANRPEWDEYSSRVGVFENSRGEVFVSHREPAREELAEIEKTRNRAEPDPTEEERIQEITEELRRRGRIQRFNALEIGRLYAEARRILSQQGPGTFGRWVKETGFHKRSSAYAYISIYKLCFDRPELVEAIKPTHLQIICAENFPDDLREEIFQRGGTSATVEELKEVAEQVHREELTPDSPAIQNLLADLDADKLSKNVQRVASNLARRGEDAIAQLKKLRDKATGKVEARGITGQIDQYEKAIESLVHLLSPSEE